MTVIVMTREMGTLGKEVAREFARRKGYSVIHHELVRSPEERAALTEESEVYRFLEGSEAEIDAWRTNRAQDGYLTPTEVLELASEGDVLIRGWGATRLLKSVPNVLSVRVCAPMEFRIAVMQKRLGVDAAAARQEIKRSDAAHGQAFLRFFQSDWRAPENYDLVLNTSHVSPSDCAEILLHATDGASFGETDEMRRALSDILLKERISETLRSAGIVGGRGQHVDATVERGNVRLFGVVKDADAHRIAARVLHDRLGIERLQNDIVHATGFGD
jgi:cytidylate kinase